MSLSSREIVFRDAGFDGDGAFVLGEAFRNAAEPEPLSFKNVCDAGGFEARFSDKKQFEDVQSLLNKNFIASITGFSDSQE